MIMDDKSVSKIKRVGGNVFKDGKLIKSETDYLREIKQILITIANKPEVHRVEMPAPVVNVPAPEVTVNVPKIEEQKAKVWKFSLSKDNKGQTTEIIAIAVE